MTRRTPPLLRRPLRLGLLAVALACGAAAAADAELSGQPQPQLLAQAPARPAPVRVAQANKPEATPTWAELTPQQQQALAPLAGTWRTLGKTHKRKWLALSANYPAMPADEQARLHSRMGEWAALTPQQRTQARLNFAESKAVSRRDRKAKWEAYQALPPEEKRKLAAGARAAKRPAPPTAAAVEPVPREKLATVPKAARTAKPARRTPRIAGTPDKVDRNTLLPQPGALQTP